MLHDLRYAFRILLRSPGFTIVAVVTLALGIGANTAMFAVFNSVLLHPLPYPQADRLVAMQEIVPSFARFGPFLPVTAWHFREWRKQSQSFEALALVGGLTYTLTSDGEPVRISGARISASAFPMLRIHVATGRTFLEEEDQPGRDRVVVISDNLWSRRFHRDPSIVGSKILLDGAPFEVVGVLPAGASIPSQGQIQSLFMGNVTEDFWKPFAISDNDLAIMSEFNYGCLGRLKPGVTIQRAVTEVNAIQKGIVSSMGEKPELRVSITGLQEQMTGCSRSTLTLWLTAAGAVLLIVVVNLANLSLARASGRRRELAIRAAIGAGMGRLVRQMLTESLLLAIAGGILGLLAAQWALDAILIKAPVDIPGLHSVHFDPAAFGFLALVSIGSGVLFGVLPAWRMAKADPQAALHAEGRSTTDRGSGRLSGLLIAAEVAMSAVCLVSGGLLLNSFVRVLHVDKGFQADHAVALGLGLPFTRYPNSDDRIRFVRDLIDQAQSIPGVIAAGISNRGPLSGEGSNLGINVEGANLPSKERPIVDYRCITPDYLRAVGIPLLSGRMIAESDGNHPVSVISAQVARKFWPEQNPIGRRFLLGGDQPITVVGVVGDVRSTLTTAPNLTVYLPYWQRDRSDFTVVVRTAMDPRSIGATLRAKVRALDSQLVVPPPRTLADIVDASVRQRRFQLSLVLGFAISALLLAAIGVYGVVSQSVTQRTKEIGIRLALGATKAHLWAVIARHGLGPLLIGLPVGLAGAMLAARSLANMLFGVRITDPVTYAAVSAVLLAAGLAACWIPARRAGRIDPLEALRQE